MSDGYWVIERQWPNKPEWGWQACETFPGSQAEAAIRERCQHWQRKNGSDIEFRYSFFVRAGALRADDSQPATVDWFLELGAREVPLHPRQTRRVALALDCCGLWLILAEYESGVLELTVQDPLDYIDLLEYPTRGEVRDLCRVLRLPLKEGAEKGAAPVGGFTVGELVSKVGGDYRFDGVVVARFKKLSGAVRYVVEDDRGVLHIYSEKNLKKRESATMPE